jgi:phosphopantetheinyl transferase (holo-ACP synthase)
VYFSLPLLSITLSLRIQTMPSNVAHQDISDSRKLLDKVMKDIRADPVELSERYIEECTNRFASKELGSGAFGTVYLGTDTILDIRFAVKRVPLSVPDQETWNKISSSFKREIAVSSALRPTIYNS